MISPKAINLVVALHNKTLNETIKWEQTIDDGIYQISYPSFSIKIFKRENMAENSDDIVIQIFNENAILIEEITDIDVTNSEDFGSNNNGYFYMNEIYKKARSQALGVEQVINNILAELGEDNPAGYPSNIGDEDIPF